MTDIWKFEHLDISKWQGAMNFGAIKHHEVLSPYVLMRVSMGAGNKDEKFHEYYSQAISNDIFRGGYFVVHPLFSPEAHLANFIEHLENRELKEIAADVELTGGMSDDMVRQRVKDTVLIFEDYYGDLVSIYSAQWFWDRYFRGETWHKKFRCHFAHYPFDPYPPNRLPADYKSPYLPSGWDWNTNPPHIHQYTSKRKYPEITSAYLDQNAADEVMKERIFGVEVPPEPEPEIPEIENMKWVSLRFYPMIGKEYTRSTPAPEEVPFEGLPEHTRLAMIRLKVESNDPDNYATIGIDGRVVEAYANRATTAIMEVRRDRTFLLTKVKSGTSMRVWIEGYGVFTQK